MFRLLYSCDTIFSKLYLYFRKALEESFDGVETKTLNDLTLIVLSMLIEEGAYSVNSLYSHFLSMLGVVGLNAFYAALKHKKNGCHLLVKALVKMALLVALATVPSAPLIMAFDDTTIKKFGVHFFAVGNLYDHSSHEKNKYINGHCFVACCLKVPVPSLSGKWKYLGIPLGFELWVPSKNISKLDIAKDLATEIMGVVGDKRQVIFMCDAWYTKKVIMQLTKVYPNLDVIGNARSDSACREFDPPAPLEKKRGRKPLHGAKLTVDDYPLTKDKLNDFHVGVKEVACAMLLHTKVWAYVSSPDLTSERKSKRLFLSTLNPLELAKLLEGYEDIPLSFNGGNWQMYSPILLYKERWVLETTFENMKTFWSLTDYKVRTAESLLTLVNLINLAYAGTVLLPYLVPAYAQYKDSSPQQIRQIISKALQEEMNIGELILRHKNTDTNRFANRPLIKVLHETLCEAFGGGSSTNSKSTHEPSSDDSTAEPLDTAGPSRYHRPYGRYYDPEYCCGAYWYSAAAANYCKNNIW